MTKNGKKAGVSSGSATATPTNTVNLTLPVVPWDGHSYVQRRMDCNFNTRQSIALRYVYDGLNGSEDQKPQRTRDGVFVDSPHKALRWILDALADELGLE